MTSPPGSPSVERFITGWLTASAQVWRRGATTDEGIRFPVPVYLVEAGDRRILIDTGLHPQAAVNARAHYARPEVTDPFRIELDRPITEQVDPATITHAGSVQLLFTPGHTPGHQSVRIGDGLVIGGDVAYFVSGLDDHVFRVYAADRAEQARSAERLRALRDAGVHVLPGHDPEVILAGPVRF